MRAVAIAVWLLMGAAGSVVLPAWTPIASAEEGTGGPGMMGYRIPLDTMRGLHDVMRNMGLVEPGFHNRMGHERPLISLMLMSKAQLGLTADQERSLRELRASFQKESIKRTAEIDVAELELAELLEQEKVDVAKTETLIRKIAMLRADLRVARIKTIEAGKVVLTPEQQEKFKRLASESTMGDLGRGAMAPDTPHRRPGVR